MSRKYDGWPVVVGMDTRAFRAAREDCNCKSEVNWIGAIVYVRSSGDFFKVFVRDPLSFTWFYSDKNFGLG